MYKANMYPEQSKAVAAKFVAVVIACAIVIAAMAQAATVQAAMAQAAMAKAAMVQATMAQAAMVQAAFVGADDGEPGQGNLITPPVKTASNALYMGYNSNNSGVTDFYIFENGSDVHFEVFNISSLSVL